MYQPDFFVFENVKGLWKTKKHRAFYDRIKNDLSKYYDMTDRLTNCIEYGAPQDRDRIFLFGIRKNYSSDIKKFPWNKYLTMDINLVLNKKIWPDTSGEQSDFFLPHKWQEKLTISHWF